jgi:hypothetical protein
MNVYLLLAFFVEPTEVESKIVEPTKGVFNYVVAEINDFT